MAPCELARMPTMGGNFRGVMWRIIPQLPSFLFLLLLLCRPCRPVSNDTRGNVTPGSAATNHLLPGVEPETPTESTSRKVALPKNTTSVIINTKQGRMGGIAVDVGGDATTRFLGVPYAAPPIGKLRFKPPEKHAWKRESGWSFRQTWNATKARPACPRNLAAWRYPFSLDSLYGDMVSKTETSEDCLYLNIFIPRNLTKIEHINTLALPVMVYLHDGNLRTEHSILRNAWRFAHDGDVIVATVSFRLGVLGYLSVDHESARGNVGLMDQSLALHWIWDNIREFGGDPAKITLFGSSLGGTDVGYHIISPQSRGLFIRAISMSGTMLSRCCRQKEPVEAATDLAKRLKCKVVPRTEMIACLRKASINHLMQAAMKTAEKFGNWWPIIDGKFIPDEPLKLLDNNKFNPVDYIIGINSHDGYQVIKDLHLDLDRDVSNDGFEDLVRHSITNYFHNNIEQATRSVLTEYHFCAQNASQLGETYVNFLTDLEYVSPAALTARFLSRNTNRKVFLYEFSHRPSYTLPTRPGFITAHHLDELEYVTGDVRYVLANVSEEERSLSAALMSAWTNFAKNGDPNPVTEGHGLRWDRYTEEVRSYVRFTTNLNASNLRTDLRPRQMALWNDYLLQLDRNPAFCDHARDHCERPMRPVTEYHAKVSTTMWVLIALCVVLLAIVAILAAKLWLPASVWQRCKPRPRTKGGHEAETKKLHPLPYCDEPA